MSTGSVAEPLPEAEAMARVLGLWTGAQSLGQTRREASDCRASAGEVGARDSGGGLQACALVTEDCGRRALPVLTRTLAPAAPEFWGPGGSQE